MKLKKKMIFISMLLVTFAFLPIKVNAEETLQKQSDPTNAITYNINYNGVPIDSLNFNISNNNDNSGVKMTINEANNIGAIGKCTNNSCVYNNITTTGVIGTITVVNSTTSKQDITLKLSGGLVAITTVTLNAGAVEQPKSKESTLSGISLSMGTMEPVFNASTLAYTVTGIKDTINSIIVTPTCTNNCSWTLSCPNGDCAVSNSKKVTLKEGVNTLNINVTSEDGSSNKTYVLTINRGEIATASAYLSSLKIQGIKISPSFDSLTNDYTTTVASDIKDLNIITTSEDPEAKVEIKGNKGLKTGENTVTITVTSSDEKNKQVYTIKVTKEEEKTTTKIVTTKVTKKKNYTILIIILSLVVVGLIIGGYFFIKNKKNKKNDKSNKNDKNDKNSLKKEETKLEKEVIDDTTGDLLDELGVNEEIDFPEYEEKPDYLDEEDPKTDVDDALDDLMQTKKIELGDLNF